MATSDKNERPVPAEIIELIRPTLRPCTIVTPQKLKKGAIPALASTRFAGEPYAEKGDEWPVCSCERPLEFIFQWNLRECPHVAKDMASGLYAFYYCFACGPWGLPDEDGESWAVRFYPEASDARAVALERPEADEEENDEGMELNACGCKLDASVSAPDWESADHRIVKLCERADPKEMWEVYNRAVAQLGVSTDDSSTRVGGYPRWMQGEDIPECSSCRKEMELIAEIGSEEERVGIMWGDLGSVYLFECPTHRGTFDFRLQCF